MNTVKATIILPTTASRGPLLAYSIGSIQNQTIKDIEIFVIGDGVSEETRDMIHSLQKEDSRIRFFDHPKHDRRGEVYRHAALQEAKGEIVCYMCDRDLWLPNHLETLSFYLQDYNFAFTAFIRVEEDDSVMFDHYPKYFGPASEIDEKLVRKGAISLSNVGHALKFYHQLPHGWRTTPEDEYTDIYMWKQFLAHPECNAFSHNEATTLYFKRGNFPGAPVSERKEDLERWAKRITTDSDIEQIKKEAYKGLAEDRLRLRLRVDSLPMISVKGFALTDVPSKIFQKVANRLKKP